MCGAPHVSLTTLDYYSVMASKERQRLKLLNALIYFSENVIWAGKVKLFKLLYFLDFIHFEQTGRSVTGLTYCAWPLGPVPEELHNEWQAPAPDFNAHLNRVNHTLSIGKVRKAVQVRKPFRPEIFTERELGLLELLAKKHFRDTAQDMTDASHFETGPWDEIYNVQGRKQEEIPYELALLRRGNDDDMEVLEMAKEYEDLTSNYG